MASPSITQIPFRSLQAGRKASSSPITPKTAMTQRLPRSSRTPGQIAAGGERLAAQGDEHHRQRDQRRLREESADAAASGDRQRQIRAGEHYDQQ
jgi:hypothetical protein